MSFQMTTREASAGGRAGTVYELSDAAGTARAEVWPFWGFNCLRWQVRLPDGNWGTVLYTAPDWESNPVPTRSGNPILFPFPGRLRDGRLAFGGRTYQLPLNDSTKSHAIHGFTPRNPWRVTETDSRDTYSSVTGEFQLSRDLPDARDQWPADFRLVVTYQLTPHTLRITARVKNPDDRPLPFGLGYHGYFSFPGVDDAVDGLVLRTAAGKVWEAEDNLPTGRTLPVPPELDFRSRRPIGAAQLDHVFTDLTTVHAPHGALADLAELTAPGRPGRVVVAATAPFRELVLFTPPHRKAVAIEPYTCSADAANLRARGVDSGWAALDPGGIWEGVVEYRWEPNAS